MRLIRSALLFLAVFSAFSATAQARIVIAAHRGLASEGRGENTISAFRAAADRGAQVVEIDLRTTSDGHIVVLHDASVDRTTNGKGKVSRLTLAQLKALDAGGGERIPTLEEVIEASRASGTQMLLDIKNGGGIPPDRLITLLSKAGALDRVIFGLRSAGDVRAYRALAPTTPILGFVPSIGQIDSFADAGANWVRLWARWIGNGKNGCGRGQAAGCLVGKLQNRGLKVLVIADLPRGASGSGGSFANLAGLGVDGILTNRSDLAAKELKATEQLLLP